MSVLVVQTGCANIASVCNALDRLGERWQLSAVPAEVARAERVILPGVGAAGLAMASLRRAGLVEVLRGLRQPLLGICLGMQLLFESSAEGQTPCLGVLPGRVTRLQPERQLPLPHMGWNRVRARGAACALLAGIPDGSHFYFVHSYRASMENSVAAVADYGGDFPALVARDNFFGTQFHPEKSAAQGARLLRNFLSS